MADWPVVYFLSPQGEYFTPSVKYPGLVIINRLITTC